MGTRGSAARPSVLPIGFVCQVLALVIGFVLVTAPFGPTRAEAAQPQATCFWIGPFDRAALKNPSLNFAYPDTAVGYWAARFRLPDGARLLLDGKFPRSRYMSLNAYRSGAPIDALTDVEFRPERGSVNPFRTGKRRNLKNSRRDWQARVVNEEAPATGAGRVTNTLYAPPEDGVQELIYRVYLPDRGRDSRGGVRLPKPVVELADGSRLTGSAACAAINHPVREITPQTVPAPYYSLLVNTPGADKETVPAFSPVHWENFFNTQLSLSIYKRGTPSEGDRARLPQAQEGGQYSNEDARYITTSINREFGEILVLGGKMPTFPATEGKRRTRMKKGQVRYWSLCQNETPTTTSVVSCLRDSQVPLTRKRMYTIVVSTKADRPKNARTACGVAWLNWGEFVDTLGREGTGFLIMRNLLAAPGFKHGIRNITKLGTEQAVMGNYFPKSTYMSSAAFKAPRCTGKKS
ncbi:MAG: hypothetical protein M3Y45_00525 [Actinomycetota bacterium]|nr:hypothetical protein [Actinomycetota bacterium]